MDLGIVAFWLFVVAAVVAHNWRCREREAMRHQTLRLLIEKNQKVDEAQLAELLNPKPAEAPEWLSPRSKSGDGYRVLRVFGTILMFAALGLAIVGAWRGILFGIYDSSIVGFACCVWLSPLFVQGSALLSSVLRDLFGTIEVLMDTRAGMFTAALCALLVWFFRRSLRFT